MQIDLGNNFCAASQVFSPSTTRILEFLSAIILLKFNKGLGAGGALKTHLLPSHESGLIFLFGNLATMKFEEYSQELSAFCRGGFFIGSRIPRYFLISLTASLKSQFLNFINKDIPLPPPPVPDLPPH